MLDSDRVEDGEEVFEVLVEVDGDFTISKSNPYGCLKQGEVILGIYSDSNTLNLLIGIFHFCELS